MDFITSVLSQLTANLIFAVVLNKTEIINVPDWLIYILALLILLVIFVASKKICSSIGRWYHKRKLQEYSKTHPKIDDDFGISWEIKWAVNNNKLDIEDLRPICPNCGNYLNETYMHSMPELPEKYILGNSDYQAEDLHCDKCEYDKHLGKTILSYKESLKNKIMNNHVFK